MNNFQTTKAYDNEIMKTTDFNYGYDAAIENMATAIQALISDSTKDYVIGGKVKPYVSQGMNVSIEPLIAFCKDTGVLVANNSVKEPVSIEEADLVNDRIDIIQIKGTEETFDEQVRAYKDPVTGEITFEATETKKRIALTVNVKKGSNGSSSAPLPDPGYVKLAEINIPAGTLNIQEENIINIEASSPDRSNESWTTKKDSVFNPMHYSDYSKILLKEHNPDGTHKNNSIKRQNIKFGSGGEDVNASAVPLGTSIDIDDEHYEATATLLTIIGALNGFASSNRPYANELLSRYSVISDLPVAASTENIDITTGGEMVIDGISCTSGQLVFLKDQTDTKQNGFYKVNTGTWSRQPGYTNLQADCFTHKLIYVKKGTANAGKFFYLSGDSYAVGTSELDFEEVTLFSTKEKPFSLVMRDENGMAEGIGGEANGITVSKPRFLTFAFNGNNQAVKIAKGTRIRLDIVNDDTTREIRYLDVKETAVYDLSDKIQDAADASSTRTGEINGRDFYIYLVPGASNDVDLVVSCNATYPNDINPDYTANNTRKIGQFHTLCAAAGATLSGQLAGAKSANTVGENYLIKQYSSGEDPDFYNFYNKQITAVTTGTIYDVVTVDHPLKGFAAGDILPESVWCLTFKPYSSGDGMVYDVDIDMAVDIYLQSGTGKNTKSAYGGTITNTREHMNHQDDMRQVRKRLLYDSEFTSIALGSNEKTNIAGSVSGVTAGGHSDTASRRMISFIGVEEACGHFWQWLNDVSSIGNIAATNSVINIYPSNNQNVFATYDGQGSFGQQYASSTALLGGGVWNGSASCGSRARHSNPARSAASASSAGRGVSRVLART